LICKENFQAIAHILRQLLPSGYPIPNRFPNTPAFLIPSDRPGAHVLLLSKVNVNTFAIVIMSVYSLINPMRGFPSEALHCARQGKLDSMAVTPLFVHNPDATGRSVSDLFDRF